MKQPKNHVLIHPLANEFLVSHGDKRISTTNQLSDAWISNYDTLRSVQGYINAVHDIKFKLIELTFNIESEKES